MPRKQSRQPSRKRLWFNVVEFDKETGRPLWRNKKSRLENDLPPCITDPTFNAMLDKLREETELAFNMHTNETNAPCSTVWRNSKKAFKPSETTKPTSPYYRNSPYENERNSPKLPTSQYYRNSPYKNEQTSPQLVMQFQHFSPLTTDDLNANQQKRQIQDFLKMKPLQYGGQNFNQGFPELEAKSDSCYSNSEAFVPDVLTNNWDSTVRLHHLDYDQKNCMYNNNCNFNSDQKVPLAIF